MQVASGDSATIGQIIQANASQSADLLELQNAAGTKQLWVDSSYNLTVKGKTTLGSSGTAFTASGACTIASFTAALGANAQTCTGLPTGAAVYCSPSASQGASVTWAAWASAANTVTINMSAGGAAASWSCMWIKP